MEPASTVVSALFAANQVCADAVQLPALHLQAIHSALTSLTTRIGQQAVAKLLCCCALRQTLLALDSGFAAHRAPGGSYGAPVDVLNNWLLATYGRDKRDALNLNLQRIATVVATHDDCRFWERVSQEQPCYITSFEQLRLLHAEEPTIRRHCQYEAEAAAGAAAAASASSSSPARERFFRAVFSADLTLAETKQRVATLLQATRTRMQQEAAQKQLLLPPPPLFVTLAKCAAQATARDRAPRHPIGAATQRTLDNAFVSQKRERQTAGQTKLQTKLPVSTATKRDQQDVGSTTTNKRTAAVDALAAAPSKKPRVEGPATSQAKKKQQTTTSGSAVTAAAAAAAAAPYATASSFFRLTAAGVTVLTAVSQRPPTRRVVKQKEEAAAAAALVAARALALEELEDVAQPPPPPVPAEVKLLLEFALLHSRATTPAPTGDTDFVAVVSLSQPLLQPLLFAPQVEAAFKAKHQVVLVRPCRADSLAAQRELEVDELQQRRSQEVWRRHFGCGSNNGEPMLKSSTAETAAAVSSAALRSLEQEGQWKPVPTPLELLEHIERDWAAATCTAAPSHSLQPSNRSEEAVAMEEGQDESKSAAAAGLPPSPTMATGQRVAPPLAMRNRPYFKKGLHPATSRPCFPQWEQRLAALQQPFVSHTVKLERVRKVLTVHNLEWSQLLEREFKAHRVHMWKHWTSAKLAHDELQWQGPHTKMDDEPPRNQSAAASAAVAQPPPPSYFIHPLFLDELQLHRRSLACLSFVVFDSGRSNSLDCKLGFQFFNLHIEQMLFTFIHHQLEGESLWFLIPFGQLPKLYTLAADMYRVLYRVTPDSLTLTHEEFERHCLVMGRALLYSKQLWPPLSLLNKHGISYRVLVLSKDDILTADGDCAHFGFSTRPGQTISVASNIATSRWLQRGLPFLVDYFTWMGELERILQQHHAGWLQLPPPLGPPSIHQLKSPLELATKAVNLCPINFACSFVRGLYADMDAMRHGSEPVGEYPCKPDADECLRHQRLCVQVVTLIHARRDFIQQVDDKSCRSCDTHDSNTDIQHTCMLCLCRGRYATQLHGSHLVTNCPAAVANKAIN